MSQFALDKHLPVLLQHKRRLEKSSIRNLFAADHERADKFGVDVGSIFFDYSKNHIDYDSLFELIALAESADIAAARNDMFCGMPINFTENRAVLHTALRASPTESILVDGADIMPEINETKARLFEFAKYTRDAGKVRDVVNIGIGGSSLGPMMTVGALAPYHDGPNIHFVSNVDGADFHDTTRGLDPKTTLFIIASKSFTTEETMSNAALAKRWLADGVAQENIGKHFVALSTNLDATAAFGIDKDRTFGFWDWVGGRYSIWSAIGLSLIIAIGPREYQKFLDGGGQADRHFREADLENNIPVLMALIGIWHRNVWNFPTHAILPYDNRLAHFPAYLQQLDMESNGKHICSDGSPGRYQTGPVIWGEPGTNGQHAFYQLLHQGTDIVPSDFLIAAKSHEEDQALQKKLLANCFAQSEALMKGQSIEEVKAQLAGSGKSKGQIDTLAPHKTFDGNRPSNTFLYHKLTPGILGQLIAFYEHKIFIQGKIWGINSFDQWGVELGKHLAMKIAPLLEDANAKTPNDHDNPSTSNLVARAHALSK